MVQSARRRPGANGAKDTQFIAGLLTQQVELGGERLEIGIVTHARFIREAINLLDNPGRKAVIVAAARAAEPATQGMGLLPAQAAASSN